MVIDNKKIKVMHLVSYIGYDGPSRGVLGQVKYADTDKFHNTICELKPTRHAELVDSVKDLGCDHVCLNKKMYDISLVFKLARILKKRRINILNTHNSLPCWYGNIAAKLARVPVVFTLRNLQCENYKFLFKKSYFYKPAILMDSFSMKTASKVVAVSDRLKDYYIENMNIPSNKIMSIRNAIDIDQLRVKCETKKPRGDIGINEDSVVIGIVGDLVERKGHKCLIEAAKTIVKSYDNIRFLIVGDGHLKDSMLETISKYGMTDNFIFAGQVKDVFPWLSIMDIFVLPSHAEGLSRALMESMAVGMPSVCSAIDGNIEAIVENETGYTFPVDDSEALAEKLMILVSDEAKRKYMGSMAYKRAEDEFNIRNLSRKYENLYSTLVSGVV